MAAKSGPDRPTAGSDPSEATSYRLSRERLSAHTEISWSIVLDAELTSPQEGDGVAERLRTSWPSKSALGNPPIVVLATGGAFDEALDDAANRPYGSGGSMFRVLLADGPAPRIAVAGHHAVVDGLGLVTVLGLAVGQPLITSSRGVNASWRSAQSSFAQGLRRLGEAVFRPPARVSSDRTTLEEGDHLLRRVVRSDGLTTAVLVAAAARATRAHNSTAGGAAERIVIAVGASSRAGASDDLEALAQRSTWFRVRVDEASPEAVQRDLDSRGPEPMPSALTENPLASWVARRLAQRLGSTLLVSNLGRVRPEGDVRSLAFFPSAHGRSGMAVGCASVGGRAVLTLRARRSDYSLEDGARFLDLVASEVQAMTG